MRHVERAEVRLRIAVDGGPVEDAIVRTTPDARAGDLVDAVRQRMGVDGRYELVLSNGATTELEERIADLPLRHGDRVVVTTQPPAVEIGGAGDSLVWELLGPDRGRGQWPARLVPGRYEIGREAGANDVVLDDPS